MILIEFDEFEKFFNCEFLIFNEYLMKSLWKWKHLIVLDVHLCTSYLKCVFLKKTELTDNIIFMKKGRLKG